jgi:hypothetical protein
MAGFSIVSFVGGCLVLSVKIYWLGQYDVKFGADGQFQLSMTLLTIVTGVFALFLGVVAFLGSALALQSEASLSAYAWFGGVLGLVLVLLPMIAS